MTEEQLQKEAQKAIQSGDNESALHINQIRNEKFPFEVS